jgi:two-component system invasion response regulator UvrY
MLADDHPIVMTGFAMSLAGVGMDVVAQAKHARRSGRDVRRAQARRAGARHPLRHRADRARRRRDILEEDPSARIVFLSQFDQDSLIKETYRLGARAFVTKDCDPADLATAVRHAHEGKLYFLPQIAERLANLSVRGDVSPQSQLDQRGLEIFKLMAEGLTNAEIAEKLNLSTKTISNISQSVKEKLGVHRQAYITKLAVKHGLIEP